MGRQLDSPGTEGLVLRDDAYLAGERTDGEGRRGLENNVPIGAVVSLSCEAHPLYTEPDPVPRFTKECIGTWAKASLSQVIVTTDGLSSCTTVTEAGCDHIQRVVCASRLRAPPECRWTDTIHCAPKTTLAGTCHALEQRKCKQTYLAAFTYPSDRRLDLRGLAASLIVNVARMPPMKETFIRGRHAEPKFQSDAAFTGARSGTAGDRRRRRSRAATHFVRKVIEARKPVCTSVSRGAVTDGLRRAGSGDGFFSRRSLAPRTATANLTCNTPLRARCTDADQTDLPSASAK